MSLSALKGGIKEIILRDQFADDKVDEILCLIASYGRPDTIPLSTNDFKLLLKKAHAAKKKRSHPPTP